MATAPQIMLSEEVRDKVGTLVFWQKARKFGYITTDAPKAKFFVRDINFPEDQRAQLSHGKMVNFNSPAGQEIGEDTYPRVSKASLLK